MASPCRTELPDGRDSRVVVDAKEFCELLVSRKHLARADEPERGLRGLMDLDSGVRYLSDELRLAASRR